MNSAKLTLPILLGGLLMLSGCGIFKTELDKCHEQREYQAARSGEPTKVPDDLQSLSEEARLPIPVGETNTEATSPEDPCLIEPPDYRAPG